MADRFAVRDLNKCTKDCLCLYVCPTGASDTENSVIDVDKCIGCGACAEACPSRAITLLPRRYPPQQKKKDAVVAALQAVLDSKAEQERIGETMADPLARAVARSSRAIAEDIARESGFMLPQSDEVRAFLEAALAEEKGEGFPAESVKKLLETL